MRSRFCSCSLLCALLLGSSLLVAGPALAAQVTLGWDPYVQKPEAPADGFKLYRKVAPATVWPTTPLLTVPAATLTATDTAVTVGTQHCYRLTAYNVAAESAPSNEVCATPPNVPSAATNLRILPTP